MSNEIKVHLTDGLRADEVLKKHIGNLMLPPNSIERLEELGEFEDNEFEVMSI